MRKALLVYLYDREEPGLSLALGFLKAYADADAAVRRTWSIEILHERTDADPRQVAAGIRAAGTDLVGFSCYSWNIRAVHEVIAGLAGEPKPIIVLGGVEVTPEPVRVMHGCRAVDVVVFGEGEATFRDLLRRLGADPDALASGRLNDIEGIAWRRGRSIRVNDARSPIEDLSTIPSPYLTGVLSERVRSVRTVPLETARGCPYRCSYCFGGRGFKRIRTMPLERVREEVRQLVRQGVTEIEFYDTNINYRRARALELFRILQAVGSHVRYWFELRAELIDGEQARALGALRYFAEVGLQSTNPAALAAVRRDLDRDRFEAGVRTLLDASMYRPCAYSRRLGVVIDVMAGLPHDTVSDVLRSFDYAFALAPSKIMVAMVRVLPASELYEDANRFHYEFDPHDEHVIRSSSSLSRQDVRRLTRFGHAVYSAYNALHAVRTIAWIAERLAIRPSAVFMDLGRLMADRDIPWKSLTVRDLAGLLADICRERGNPAAASGIPAKLTAETVLNLLQFLREKRPAFWSRGLLRLVHRGLSAFRALPPLPDSASPRPARPPARRLERSCAAAVQSTEPARP